MQYMIGVDSAQWAKLNAERRQVGSCGAAVGADSTRKEHLATLHCSTPHIERMEGADLNPVWLLCP